MLKLRLPFRLVACGSKGFFGSSAPETLRAGTSEVMLEGVSITIISGTKTCEVSSACPPEHDGPAPRAGTIWARSLWRLTDEMSIEQQMAIPAGGSAIAISWRAISPAIIPCRIRVIPIFGGFEPWSDAGFEFEPEAHGGRLSWQPLRHSSKIIADTNGFFVPIAVPSAAGPALASFEFDLSPHPAVLIFSAESPRQTAADPLIGGFLARLSAIPVAAAEQDYFHHLVAA